jgi:hypothetical protein
MDTRIATFVSRLIAACVILLVLPSTAMGAPMSISGPSSVSEGASAATYTVSCGDTEPLQPPPPLPQLPPIPNTGTLTVTVTDGPAPASQAADHGAPTQLALVCSVATTGFTFDVPIVNDALDEADEQFTVTVAGALVAEGAVSESVVTTITDDDEPITPIAPGPIGGGGAGGAAQPTLSLPKTVSVKENDGRALFSVTLSQAATGPIGVSWKTINWTAKSADYEKANGQFVFQPGQRTKTISVRVRNDRRDEPDEAFGVVLENPAGAVLGQRGAFGLIADDDGPKVTIGKPRVRGKRLVIIIGCPDSASGCEGKLVGKAGKLKLGRKAFDLDGGEKRRLRLKMSRNARKKLAERALRAKLKATASDTTGDTLVTTRKARLKQVD